MTMFDRPHHRVMRRGRDGALQTPVHEWRRDGQRIRLIGMVHVGEAEYYRRVQAMLDAADRDGAAVHYEGVRPQPADAELTAWEREILPGPDAPPRPWMREVAALMGLVYQRDALTMREHWHNVDVDRLTALRSMGPEAGRRLFERSPAFLDEIGEMSDGARHFLAGALRAVARTMPATHRLVPASLTLGRPAMRMVEDWRNILATTAALREVHGRPVVLVWGAGHLSGMGDILKTNGFRLAEPVVWLDAIGRRPASS